MGPACLVRGVNMRKIIGGPPEEVEPPIGPCQQWKAALAVDGEEGGAVMAMMHL